MFKGNITLLFGNFSLLKNALGWKKLHECGREEKMKPKQNHITGEKLAIACRLAFDYCAIYTGCQENLATPEYFSNSWICELDIFYKVNCVHKNFFWQDKFSAPAPEGQKVSFFKNKPQSIYRLKVGRYLILFSIIILLLFTTLYTPQGSIGQ